MASLSWIELACNSLQCAVDSCQTDDVLQKLTFLIEQLELLSASKTRRSYSPSLIISCFSVYSSSRAAYECLYGQNILSIPCSRTLIKVTKK